MLHRHCILLRLNKAIKWNNDVVDEIFMIDMYWEENYKKQMLINIANVINSYGMIEIKAFAGQDSPNEAKTVRISTDDIVELEMITNEKI